MIRMEAEPSRTRYIGDNHVEDVGAARRAGIHSVLVARNGSVPNGQYQPDTVVKSLRELI